MPLAAHAPQCTIARALPAKDALAGHRGSFGHPLGLPGQRGGATRTKLGSPQHPMRHVHAQPGHPIARAFRAAHGPFGDSVQVSYLCGTSNQHGINAGCEFGLPEDRIRKAAFMAGRGRMRDILHGKKCG